MEHYFSCCGKSICTGCLCSFYESGNDDKCPFYKSDRGCETREKHIEEIMKRVEVNDSESIYVLANYYFQGLNDIQQDQTKAIELFSRAANLGLGKAHWNLADIYYKGGDLKKARGHCEAAAMKGHEVSRCNL